LNSPVWSRDGKYVAYAMFVDTYGTVYRKPADGTGAAEALFRYTPGAGVGLTDWSPDSRFLTFSTGAVLMIPVQNQEKPLERKAIEWIREDYEAFEGHFSPDGKLVAYMSNEVDVRTAQIYVRPFDANKPQAPAGPAVQVTNLKGGGDPVGWRQDGKEMYFINADRELMAVDISTSPALRGGTPRVLFQIPDALANVGDVSPDGQRVILAMPVR